MEKVTAFFHKHPVESALLAAVAVIALYFAFKPSASSGANNQQAALQNAYFQAEGLQAQSGAAIQVANINAGRDVAIAGIAGSTSTANATTYANESVANTAANDAAQTAGYPYQIQAAQIGVQNNAITQLGTVAGQTQTVTNSSSGFFGIGGGSSTSTSSTAAATSAASYLAELANGNFTMNG